MRAKDLFVLAFLFLFMHIFIIVDRYPIIIIIKFSSFGVYQYHFDIVLNMDIYDKQK